MVLPAFVSGCSNTADETPAPYTGPPRWVWSMGDGGYSIVVDRNTHEPIRDVTPSEAFGIMGTSSHSENPVVIDVRTPEEYAGGYIRGAINIDYRAADFRDKIVKLDKDKQYIVYCRTGVRSSEARDIMEEIGFKHVINMTGGITEWEAESFIVYP